MLLALASHIRDKDIHGVCWPSQRTIAAEAFCSIRTVRDLLRRLQSKGFVTIVEPGQPKRSARYKINVARLYRAEDPAGQREEESAALTQSRAEGLHTSDRQDSPSRAADVASELVIESVNELKEPRFARTHTHEEEEPKRPTYSEWIGTVERQNPELAARMRAAASRERRQAERTNGRRNRH